MSLKLGCEECISEYGHDGRPYQFVFSPSGRWAASTAWNRTGNPGMSECIMWDSKTGTSHPSQWYHLADAPSYPTLPTSFAFCSTEKQWALASRHDISVFPLETPPTSSTDHSQPVGRIDLQPLDGLVARLLWSRDGSRIFAQDSKANVHIYDALTFTHLRTLSPPPVYTQALGVVQRVSTLALSEDEQYLLSDVALPKNLSSTIIRSSICVWALATGSCELHFLHHHDNATTGTYSGIYATALRQHSSPGREDHRLHVVAICNNGTVLTAAVGLPDAVTAFRPAGLPASVRNIPDRACFSSDGTRVLVAESTCCLVLDTLTGATIAGIDSGRFDALFRGVPDGAELSGDGRVAMIRGKRPQWWFGLQPEWWLWRVEDGTLHQVLNFKDGPAAEKFAGQFASPDIHQKCEHASHEWEPELEPVRRVGPGRVRRRGAHHAPSASVCTRVINLFRVPFSGSWTHHRKQHIEERAGVAQSLHLGRGDEVDEDEHVLVLARQERLPFQLLYRFFALWPVLSRMRGRASGVFGAREGWWSSPP
ncbi:uncharacterized protein BXZ73DRAFT_76661 [Epithele typhae]|uniref:uncharacterized protein n=1 Tax=Epithele typhae TaxID=378194 RepID=UPI002007D3DD|nr:uncharacterized protein BXZ73DRAFT_76661 [Epithele typhae]KAH9936868.1 hypothetical protein BXZ73DRAFT_76661 [Epithele typhae]